MTWHPTGDSSLTHVGACITAGVSKGIEHSKICQYSMEGYTFVGAYSSKIWHVVKDETSRTGCGLDIKIPSYHSICIPTTRMRGSDNRFIFIMETLIPRKMVFKLRRDALCQSLPASIRYNRPTWKGWVFHPLEKTELPPLIKHKK